MIGDFRGNPTYHCFIMGAQLSSQPLGRPGPPWHRLWEGLHGLSGNDHNQATSQ